MNRSFCKVHCTQVAPAPSCYTLHIGSFQQHALTDCQTSRPTSFCKSGVYLPQRRGIFGGTGGFCFPVPELRSLSFELVQAIPTPFIIWATSNGVDIR